MHLIELMYQVTTWLAVAFSISAFFHFLNGKNWKGVIWSCFAIYVFVGLAVTLYLHKYRLSTPETSPVLSTSQTPPSISLPPPAISEAKVAPAQDAQKQSPAPIQEQKTMSDKKPNDSDPPRSMTQTNINSPGSIQAGGNVTINPSVRYIEISSDVDGQLESNLSRFKSKYAGRQLFINVDPESGSSTRNKVAGVIGRKLSTLGLGRYDSTRTIMGGYPDHPTTIVCQPSLIDIAHSLAKALSVYIGTPHVQTQNNLPDGYILLYLYGQPQFQPDGTVIFE